MIAFHTVCPEVAAKETRSVAVGGAPNLPAGEYAFIEFYCEDLGCDCRRVFIEVIGRHGQNQVLASINFGWEKESFYRKRMPWDPKAPREVVSGALDPINAQSAHSHGLLELFQQHVLDGPYRMRLKQHERLFHDELRRRLTLPGNERHATR